jgi:hypothetical protein
MVIDPNTVPLAGLDGKTDLLTVLLTGKQGWKCPVTLLAGLLWVQITQSYP